MRPRRWVHEHVPDGMLVCYGHAGDGNLHYNVNRRPAASTGRRFWRARR